MFWMDLEKSLETGEGCKNTGNPYDLLPMEESHGIEAPERERSPLAPNTVSPKQHFDD